MYHKPADSFVSRLRLEVAKADEFPAENTAEEASDSSAAVTSADVVCPPQPLKLSPFCCAAAWHRDSGDIFSSKLSHVLQLTNNRSKCHVNNLLTH